MRDSVPDTTLDGGDMQGPPILDPEDTCALLPHPPADREFDAKWKRLMDKGRRYNLRSKSEDAYKMYEAARGLCESTCDFPEATHYWQLAQSRLGFTNRRFGRHEIAIECLEAALKEMGTCKHYVETTGELGVVYRYLNRIDDAKDKFEAQYKKAKEIKFEREICRSIGNLAITNYELSLRHLDTAIEQLNERVETAKRLREALGPQAGDEEWIVKNLECIGHGRLSLCHSTRGDTRLAIDAGKKAVEIAEEVADEDAKRAKDSTVVASARLFYGRALLLGGKRKEALEQFDRDNECTAAISLCKEPSELHRRFLRQLVEARVNMGLLDEHNYTALDYAVFNNDEGSQEIVMDGLRQNHDEEKVRQLLDESRLRRSYRELFQEKLRPVLIHSRSVPDCFRELRRVYAETLATDEWKRKEFDDFKYMRYSDFLSCGCLQRHGKDSARLLANPCNGDADDDFVIFFSYRWINNTRQLPDNAEHAQYRRMILAIKQLLEQYQEVDETKVGIWVDYSCINQEDSESGVHALPMILAQCNAVISLVDNDFPTRAWCSLESLLVQTLKQSYSIHQWYEQVPLGHGEDGEGGYGSWKLKVASINEKLNIREKSLTVKDDWPKVLFLEKQAKLLGGT
ncbi:hypothetical protein FOCG_01605 [Fusarium oxysporum f. sp. radicis-lycopersici 26381]|uniref:Heterokaryon incompatibility domain-containing protein n=1 Tax=Fusarium oxysporum f. sp. narcissi TaxID=451672 RepID=A0A4Q2VXJ9_FUSOX|nr:hypothetical protein FOCG_01605 [Fusarium oxysporum f. sp. radicis-lycopersici 26381]RYC91524.1 hypothetical protein BFJ63_vAg5535 [Fusarium oxysporum f. sp. narcissi]